MKTVTEPNSGADTTGEWTLRRPGELVKSGDHIYPMLTILPGFGLRRISAETRMTARPDPGVTPWIPIQCWKVVTSLNAVSTVYLCRPSMIEFRSLENWYLFNTKLCIYIYQDASTCKRRISSRKSAIFNMVLIVRKSSIQTPLKKKAYSMSLWFVWAKMV